MNDSNRNFTEGPILFPLIRFALPVLMALFLQAMYGAVDLLIVGRFSSSADVSAVATGSQLMLAVTRFVSGLSMGTTILLGQQIGRGRPEEGGETVGGSICLFTALGAAGTLVLVIFARQLSCLMQVPPEAFEGTLSYVRICGAGFLAIIAYNLIGSIFRGIGDSRTPLITVAIACVCNILGDLLLVRGFHMGAAGAAAATVFAQLLSVILSLAIAVKRGLPFHFKKEHLYPEGKIILKVCSLGIPIALSDTLVSVSFLVIQSIVNSLGVIPSAGIGVAQKVCAFIMLVPSSFMQSLSAFVAQNYGAGKYDRAVRTLKIGIGLSLLSGLVMGWFSFFHGDILSAIFSNDPEVVAASADYLKAYAIDCFLTAFFFCFVGFYNGIGLTKFVMAEGIAGAFGVRVPVSYFMSRLRPLSLFRIGLATPCSSLLQTMLCLICFRYVRKKIFIKPESPPPF